MTEYEKQEFWNALTRLYDSTVQLNQAIDKHTKQLEIDAENIRKLANIAAAHEQRLDDLDGGKQ